jgi:hypothetical protein
MFSIFSSAAGVLRALHDDGYIDWHVKGESDLEGLADQLDGMVTTYSGCAKAPALRSI